MTGALDRRLFAFRPDLAEKSLEGRIEALRFTEGEVAHVAVPVADIRPRPDAAAGIDTQALFGENLQVFERADGWAWVKCEADSYVGYVEENLLAGGRAQATHIVIRPRTFVYPGPDLRVPHSMTLSMGSRIAVAGEAETRGTRYLLMADGKAVIAAHCHPLSEPSAADPVSVAALFIETPYLWGGRSGFGIDCSGLVQMALAMAGRAAPRDSDLQAAGLGKVIDPADEPVRRGDLVFWKGHVAFLEDTESILHASGGTMAVTREKLADAVARIRPLYGEPTCYRRP